MNTKYRHTKVIKCLKRVFLKYFLRWNPVQPDDNSCGVYICMVKYPVHLECWIHKRASKTLILLYLSWITCDMSSVHVTLRGSCTQSFVIKKLKKKLTVRTSIFLVSSICNNVIYIRWKKLRNFKLHPLKTFLESLFSLVSR